MTSASSSLPFPKAFLSDGEMGEEFFSGIRFFHKDNILHSILQKTGRSPPGRSAVNMYGASLPTSHPFKNDFPPEASAVRGDGAKQASILFKRWNDGKLSAHERHSLSSTGELGAIMFVTKGDGDTPFITVMTCPVSTHRTMILEYLQTIPDWQLAFADFNSDIVETLFPQGHQPCHAWVGSLAWSTRTTIGTFLIYINFMSKRHKSA